MLKKKFVRAPLLLGLAALTASIFVSAPAPASAQGILMSVNGRPITGYDVAQRMKLLRLLKKPSSRQAAIDDLIADKVKLDEMAKFTIHLSSSDIMAQGARDAQEAKIPPAAFANMLHSAGIDEANWREHFTAEAEWELYVKTMNKTLDVSNNAVQAALAKRGQGAGLTEYLVREITIVVPNLSAIEQRMPEANELRARFNGCRSGVTMARAMPNVVVQALVMRSSTNLSEEARKALETTGVGRLTAPERSAQGISMIALCEKKVLKDDPDANAPIRDELLKDRLERASAKLYAPLRQRAVIVRFHS